MKFVLFALVVIVVLAWFAFGSRSAAKQASVETKIKQLQYTDEPISQVTPMTKEDVGLDTLPKTEADWKKKLSPEQYHVLREHGTERAFTGELWNSKKEGVYVCAGCGQPLFSSDTKFDSGTGWPSYWKPINEQSVETHEDNTLFMSRTEVVCSRCQGHLGHVFDDGPRPTGLRYCLNSAALKLEAAKQ